MTFGVICEITVDVICGRSSVDNSDAILNLAAHFPAGTSVKDLEHYEQLGFKNLGNWIIIPVFLCQSGLSRFGSEIGEDLIGM